MTQSSMSNKKTDLEWAKLLKYQDEHVREEDRRIEEQNRKLKLLYKSELERMINENRMNMNKEKYDDHRRMLWLQEREKARLKEEEEKNRQLLQIKERMARQNLRSTQNRRKQVQYERESEKNIFGAHARKAVTEVEEEKFSMVKHRQQAKKQLSRAYDEQISIEQNKRILQKLEDQKFAHLLQQIEAKKARNREAYFEKIHGFQQNPEVYQISKNIINEKQKIRENFISKMAQQDRQQYQERRKRLQQSQKMKELKNVSEFNRHYFQNKAFRQRHQSLRQIEDYQHRWQTLEQQRQAERQRQERQIYSRKKNLKLELQEQIERSHILKTESNRMNERQYLLNKSDNIPSLPGLSRDFTSVRQKKILESFLKGSQRQ